MIVKDDLNDAVLNELISIAKAKKYVVEGKRGATQRNYLRALGFIDQQELEDGKLSYTLSAEGKEFVEREQLL